VAHSLIETKDEILTWRYKVSCLDHQVLLGIEVEYLGVCLFVSGKVLVFGDLHVRKTQIKPSGEMVHFNAAFTQIQKYRIEVEFANSISGMRIES
jgi:hypothetical protein